MRYLSIRFEITRRNLTVLRLHLCPFCQTKSNIKSLQDELDQALTESGGVETPKVKNLKDQLQSAVDELAQLEKKLGELGGEPTTVELQFYPKCRVVLLLFTTCFHSDCICKTFRFCHCLNPRHRYQLIFRKNRPCEYQLNDILDIYCYLRQ